MKWLMGCALVGAFCAAVAAWCSCAAASDGERRAERIELCSDYCERKARQ